MNGVGKPCAGERHARFDRGLLGRLKLFCGGCWSQAGVLKDAATMAWSGPQPQQQTTEPVAYLTQTCLIMVEHLSQLIVIGVRKLQVEVRFSTTQKIPKTPTDGRYRSHHYVAIIH